MQEYELTPHLTGREYGVSVSETGEETPIDTSAVPLYQSVADSPWPSVPYDPYVCPYCGCTQIEQNAKVDYNTGQIVGTYDWFCMGEICDGEECNQPIRLSEYEGNPHQMSKEDN